MKKEKQALKAGRFLFEAAGEGLRIALARAINKRSFTLDDAANAILWGHKGRFFDNCEGAAHWIIKEYDENSPFQIPLPEGRILLAKLAEGGVKFVYSENPDSSPLLQAARGGLLSAPLLVALVKNRENIGLRNIQGKNFLMLRAMRGDRETEEQEMRGKEGWSKPDKEILDFALENGVDINARDEYGNTLLLLSAMYKNLNKDTFHMYISRGADMYAVNKTGDTLLSLALNTGLLESWDGGGNTGNILLGFAEMHLHNVATPSTFGDKGERLSLNKEIEVIKGKRRSITDKAASAIFLSMLIWPRRCKELTKIIRKATEAGIKLALDIAAREEVSDRLVNKLFTVLNSCFSHHEGLSFKDLAPREATSFIKILLRGLETEGAELGETFQFIRGNLRHELGDWVRNGYEGAGLLLNKLSSVLRDAEQPMPEGAVSF